MTKGNSVILALNDKTKLSLENADLSRIPEAVEINKALDRESEQMMLDYFSFSDVVDNLIYRATDAAAPGAGAGLQAAGAVAKTSPTQAIKGAVKSIFGGGSSNANNASLRKELDAFTIPADFDSNLYWLARPDVGEWANQQGLNDAGYVKKLIVRHYFTHGKNEGMAYPKNPADFNPTTYMKLNPGLENTGEYKSIAAKIPGYLQFVPNVHYYWYGAKAKRPYKTAAAATPTANSGGIASLFNPSNSTDSGKGNNTLIYVIIGIIVLALIAFFIFKSRA